MQEFKVKFSPQDKTVTVPGGTDLLTAAVKAGIVLSSACGGEGTCGKCKVLLGKDEALACQTIVESDISVNIPAGSFETPHAYKPVAEEFTKGVILENEHRITASPLVRKIYLELPAPTSDDAESDLERIYRIIEKKIGHTHVSTRLANVKHLGEVLRDSDFRVTAVIAGGEDAVEILAIEPQNTTKSNYGFAFDIGTTTVAGQLIDLNKNEIMGSRIAFNRQASYGSDVITRIVYASNPKGLETLNAAVIDNVNEIIEDLSSEGKVNLSDVYSIVFAGNMTMTHLLLKIDPSHIRKAPYVPVTASFQPASVSELGLKMHPKAIAYFLPGVAAYVGGDIVSGLLACGIPEADGLSLLIDIGTNGEIVLGNRDWMIGAAASAGPAFEGSGLKHGMKAVRGAVNKVDIDDKLNVNVDTIGGDKPKGICGSGYIDLLCKLLQRRIIGKDGKIDGAVKSDRIRRNENTKEFVVVFKNNSATGEDIVIDEDDIENLKRSKGAIYSAIISLINKLEQDISNVNRIYIAGGFGNYLNIDNAIRIGLLPDVRRDKYQFIGNSSLAGARMSLISRDALAKTEEIHKKVTYLDLSAEPKYMDEYIASLFFPHTDIGRFPSVR
jgi:uncharacterized 2Fe-2S/4Fe-4S cluster protein (DUF4445 family)